MHPLIESHQNEIFELCREFGVSTLELFGSICTDLFDEETSDVDFMVEYLEDTDLGPWVGRHFELRDRLAQLLGRSVDLVMVAEHRNPFIRKSIRETRRPLYAA